MLQCPAQSPRARIRQGFTLIEILMVVAILGIASAIIIPGIGTRDDIVCAAAARVVVSDLMYAQNRAIAVQKTHYVRFSGQQYSLCDSTALQPIDHPLQPSLNNGKYVMTFGPGGNNGLERCSIGAVTIGATTIVGFNDLGEPSSFNAGTLAETPLTQPATIIVQSGTYSLTIQIEPFTGEASVH